MDWAAPGNREGVGAELYLASLCEVYEPHAVRGRGILGGVAGRENLCLRTFQEATTWLDVVGHVEASVSVRSISLEHQVHGWERPSKGGMFRGDSAHGRVDKSLPCKRPTNLRRLEGGRKLLKKQNYLKPIIDASVPASFFYVMAWRGKDQSCIPGCWVVIRPPRV